MPDILVLIGTKAQFIKTAPVLNALDASSADYRLIYTGQHSETFDTLEAAFGTRPPDDVMVSGSEADSAGGLLGWTFRFFRAVRQRLGRKEWIGARWGVVHGDTLSTLLTTVALRLAGVPVAHIEAGLRSPRLLSPFPEEIIRRLVSRMVQLHLAPDDLAATRLAGIQGRVINTQGNTLRDALLMALGRVEALPTDGGYGGYAVVSLHRSENLGSAARFDFLMNSVERTAARIPLKFVLHPVTRRKLHRTGWFDRLASHPNITLLERMDYVAFVRIMLGACFLMTDGGSNQEEAAMLGLPALLMRTATERPDGLEAGSVVLSGLDAQRIDVFVEQHANRMWPLRSVENDSPSQRVVSALLNDSGSAAD